jgi:hypothetical protein
MNILPEHMHFNKGHYFVEFYCVKFWTRQYGSNLMPTEAHSTDASRSFDASDAKFKWKYVSVYSHQLIINMPVSL